jgi:hypothetical protein
MGQPVAVTEKPGAHPGVVRFETNRTFSGMGHERFASTEEAWAPTASAEIARRLFATGRVGGVHVYANMVTVDLHNGYSSDGLGDIIRELYRYWHPGMKPPTFEDLVPDEAAGGDAAAGAGAGAAGDDPALAAVAARVPMPLLERARAARAKYAAAN